MVIVVSLTIAIKKAFPFLCFRAFLVCLTVCSKLSWLSFLWLFILSSGGGKWLVGGLHVRLRLLLLLARVIMKLHVHLSARIKCNLLPGSTAQKKTINTTTM